MERLLLLCLCDRSSINRSRITRKIEDDEMKSYERFAMLLVALSIIAFTLDQPVMQKAAAQSAVATSAKAREATPELRQQTFEIVWRTIKEKHFDPKFNGVDWDKVHDVYAPRVAKVTSDKEFYELLQEMLGELHQSHFVVLSPDVVSNNKTNTKEAQEASVRVEVRIIGDEAVIWRVISGSTGERAGLRPGFVVKKIDDETIEQISAQAHKRQESSDAIRERII